MILRRSIIPGNRRCQFKSLKLNFRTVDKKSVEDDTTKIKRIQNNAMRIF